MYRLAAIDLDDTLLSRDKTIGAANRRAVDRLREAGMEVVLASGRRHENMLPYHRQLGLEGFVVSSQGAMVRRDDRVLHQVLLAPVEVHRVVAEAAERRLTSIYYHLDGVFASALNAWTDVYQQLAGASLVLCDDPHQLEAGTLKVISTGSPEEIVAHYPGMAAAFRGQLEVLVSNRHQIECMTLGVSKASGLAALLPEYGLRPEQVVAFGDNENDVAMLRWAGLGVAMPHGTPAALEAADRIAPDGDPDSCLARAVEELLSQDGSWRDARKA